MIVMPMMLALGMVGGSAQAGKSPGLRLKYSTDLIEVASQKTEIDGAVDDGSESRLNTVAILDHDSRFEVTKMLGEGIEVGGILGISQTRGTIGDEEDPADRHVAAMVTGAYNVGLGKGMRFFVQPILGIDNTTIDLGEDSEEKFNFTVLGANAGVRFKLNKKVTFDTAAEGLYKIGKVSVGGESNDDVRLKQTDMGIRLGLSVRI